MKQRGSVLLIVMVVLSVIAMLTMHSLQKQQHYMRLVDAQQNQANNLLDAENILLATVLQNSDLWHRRFEQNYRSCFQLENSNCNDSNLQMLLTEQDSVKELFAEYKPDESGSFWHVFLHYEKEVRLVLELALKPERENGSWQYYD